MNHHAREKHAGGNNAFDLAGAVIAGLVVGFIVSRLRYFGDEVEIGAVIRIIFLSTSSYFIVALLSLWRGRHSRRFPRWLFVAIAGSTLTFLSINLVGSINYIWRFRNSSAIGYASGAIKDEVGNLLIATLTNSLIALPIIGMVRYIGSKIVIIRKHDRIQ